MKFTEALWDEDHAQLMFKTDIISPVTGQPYVMTIMGVGNWDEANRIFKDVEMLAPRAKPRVCFPVAGYHDELRLERLPSRFGLLKSNGPSHSDSSAKKDDTWPWGLGGD